MSLADVLEAGNWVTPDQLSNMSIQIQRNTLIGGSEPDNRPAPQEIGKLDDQGLAGCGVAAFLLQMGIGDEAHLKGSLQILRDTLIKEAAANTSYDQT